MRHMPDGVVAGYMAVYKRGGGVCGFMPNRDILREAVRGYGSDHGGIDVGDVKEENGMLIQISGVVGKGFVDGVVGLLKKGGWKRAVVVGMGDARAGDEARDAAKAIGREASGVQVRSVGMGEDEILYMASVAKHVVVHRGVHSGLVGLVVSGSMYYTKEFEEFMKKNEYKWMIERGIPLYADGRHADRGVLDYMGAVKASCCTFAPFGTGDGEKILCENANGFATERCWVLSVGCAGKWSFESSVIRQTQCHVHTFDCTGDWTVPKELQSRVTLHKICLGEKEERRPEGDFRTWQQIIQMGSGSGSVRMPAVAKMDIEGYEYPVLRSLVDTAVDDILPEQLALEVHVRTGRTIGDPWEPLPGRAQNFVPGVKVREFFGNLSRRGYRLVHRADNPFCKHCSEVTLLRDAGLPPGGV